MKAANDRNVKREYFRNVNMTLKEINDWVDNPLSKKASVSRKPVIMARTLIRKKSKKWEVSEVKWAKKAIVFIKMMKKVKAGKPVSNSRLSRRTISLMNWGFNPNK